MAELLGVATLDVSGKDKADPEDEEGHPSNESVDTFELIMETLAESWKGEADHAYAENAQYPRQNKDGESIRIQLGKAPIRYGAPSGARGRKDEPDRGACASSRVNTAKMVYFCAVGTHPERKPPGNGAEHGVESVDDEFLAYKNAGNQIAGYQKVEPLVPTVDDENCDEKCNV